MTQRVIGAAIEVHRVLGPGLMESAYAACLCHEVTLIGVPFRREVDVSVRYKSVQLDCGYRVDLLVADQLVVELKAVMRCCRCTMRRFSPTRSYLVSERGC